MRVLKAAKSRKHSSQAPGRRESPQTEEGKDVGYDTPSYHALLL